MSIEDTSRRQLLKKAVLALGLTTLSPQIIAAAISGKTSKTTTFDSNELALLAKVSELMIPTTDTPGAITAGVPEFIDAVVSDIFNRAHREKFMGGLTRLNDFPHALTGKLLLKIDEATCFTLLEKIDHNAFINRAKDPLSAFYRELKELVFLGYYTSEIGASIELSYNPIPGDFKGDVPLADIEKAWATT